MGTSPSESHMRASSVQSFSCRTLKPLRQRILVVVAAVVATPLQRLLRRRKKKPPQQKKKVTTTVVTSACSTELSCCRICHSSRWALIWVLNQESYIHLHHLAAC